jgi:hypothetical protein
VVMRVARQRLPCAAYLEGVDDVKAEVHVDHRPLDTPFWPSIAKLQRVGQVWWGMVY